MYEGQRDKAHSSGLGKVIEDMKQGLLQASRSLCPSRILQMLAAEFGINIVALWVRALETTAIHKSSATKVGPLKFLVFVCRWGITTYYLYLPVFTSSSDYI